MTLDCRFFYVRYRGGLLAWGFGSTLGHAVKRAMELRAAGDARAVGGPLDGDLATGAMLTHLADVIEVVP